jgi:hypothetical protein
MPSNVLPAAACYEPVLKFELTSSHNYLLLLQLWSARLHCIHALVVVPGNLIAFGIQLSHACASKDLVVGPLIAMLPVRESNMSHLWPCPRD